MLWIIIVLFLVMSILFLCGKGSFLIAGYNTASAQQKLKYDEKKLCRVMGVGMSVMTLSLIFLALNEDIGQYIFAVGFIAGLAIIFVGNMTYAKKPQYEWAEDGEINKIKWYKNVQVYSGIFSIVVLIGVGIMLFSGDIEIKMENNSLTASAFLTSSYTIDYNNIEKVEYQENISTGSRTWGTGSFQISAGNFKNDTFGNYKLYAYSQCHSYVVISTSNGYVVVNDKDEAKTKELYEKIQKVIQ